MCTYIYYNDIILTLEECIFTPYSSQRRAVSSKLRSASAGDWPLKIKLNNFVNRSIETVPEIKIMHFSYDYYIHANTTTGRSNISPWFSGALPFIFFSKSAISNRVYLLIKWHFWGKILCRFILIFTKVGAVII